MSLRWVIGCVILTLVLSASSGCASSGKSRRTGASVGFHGHYGGPWQGRYYGYGQAYPEAPEVPPDIDDGPVAVPLPEPAPDMGMPDFGMPDFDF